MSYTQITNPPNAPAGFVAEWNGAEWVLVPITQNIIPTKPVAPEGYEATWNGKEWIVSPIPVPPMPPAPTPDQITASTINTAVYELQVIAYLTTAEMGQHITPESRQEVTDYIHAVANILATAQQKFGTGEAYAPTFPPTPTALPSKPKSADSEEAPFIKFIVVD